MFPGVLAEGPFSLRQGERSCALSISAELSPEGGMSAYSIAASHVTPTLRMTYDEVDAALASSDPARLTPDLRALMQVPTCARSAPNLTDLCPSTTAVRLPCQRRCVAKAFLLIVDMLRRGSACHISPSQDQAWKAGTMGVVF